MRKFCSTGLKIRQHNAQTLRFGKPLKPGIIEDASDVRDAPLPETAHQAS
jgi:hypothetical protein